jgi:hypothetical protein
VGAGAGREVGAGAAVTDGGIWAAGGVRALETADEPGTTVPVEDDADDDSSGPEAALVIPAGGPNASPELPAGRSRSPNANANAAMASITEATPAIAIGARHDVGGPWDAPPLRPVAPATGGPLTVAIAVRMAGSLVEAGCGAMAA